MQATADATQRGLFTVKKWTRISWPPEGGLRHLIFFAKENGCESVIRRVGRRVLIDEAAFFGWLNKQRSHMDQSETAANGSKPDEAGRKHGF